MNSDNVLLAFGLTIFAGLSTGIGSALAFWTRRTNTRFLSVSLGFSAGVMLYVSLVEIFGKARDALSAVYGDKSGFLFTTLAFFGGIALIALIDALVPKFENPHEPRFVEEMGNGASSPNPSPNIEYSNLEHSASSGDVSEKQRQQLLRMGLFSALAIAIHNFPEGLATFVGALKDPALGVSIAVAVAIHNIPEGIAVSVPLYFATGNRKKAFGWSFLSGVSEPVGALVGYFLLRPFFNDTTFGLLFAGVAGIMVYISLDELLPTAEKYGEHHLAMGGVVAGMMVMAASLVLLA